MSTVERKQDATQVVREEVEQLLNAVGSHRSALATSLRDKVSPLLDTAKESLSNVGEHVKERAADAAKKTDAYAHTNPWQIAGLAALVGLTVGVLASRRR